MKITTGNHYLAYVLDERCSQILQENCPSDHPIKKYHHVTIAYDFDESDVERLQSFVDSDPVFHVYSMIFSDVVDVLCVYVNGEVMQTSSSVTHVTAAYREGARSSDSNRLLRGLIERKKTVDTHWILTGHFELVAKTGSTSI